MTEPKATFPTPQEFFDRVIQLDDRLAVNRACNELLDSMAENYAVSTISKKLSSYKQPFYTYQHSNPDLNETVETKDGQNQQHIAARLLTLSDEQYKTLGVDRQQRDNARAGFDKEGELRAVEKPPVDIAETVKKSLELLTSNDPHSISSGLLNLTGLRANELNMPKREYPDLGIVERDMVVLGEFLIGFKGISKKHDSEDVQAYHARVTLAPAELIVKAYQRFKSSKAVQAISPNYEEYRKGFQDTFSNRFNELFSKQLSTIEAYNDNGELSQANGTPHKARAFYACALRAILKGKNFGGSASNKYIQLCLAHENTGVTIKYLGRYDEKEFINPIEINIPTSIKELGKMTEATIEKLTEENTKAKTEKTTETGTKTTRKKTPQTKKTTATKKPTAKNTFDVDTFVNALDPELQIKFAELLNSESSITNAVIGVFNMLKQKSASSGTTSKKVTVSDEVERIINGIMTYNSQQTLSSNRAVPTYALINKIAEKWLNKSIAKVTVDNYLKANSESLHNTLEKLEIPGGLYNSQWNGKYHRKTLDVVIESVITILNQE